MPDECHGLFVVPWQALSMLSHVLLLLLIMESMYVSEMVP